MYFEKRISKKEKMYCINLERQNYIIILLIVLMNNAAYVTEYDLN